MNNYDQMLSRSQHFVLLVVSGFAGFAIPISTAAQNISSLLLLICWLSMAPLRRQTLRALSLPFVQVCLALYLLMILGTLWSEVDWKSRLDMLNRMRPYILAPIFVACMLPRAGRNGLIIGFCAGVGVSVLVSIGMAVTGHPILNGTDGNYTAFRTHTYHNLFVGWVIISLFAALLWGKIESRGMRVATIIILIILIFDAMFLVRGRTAQVLIVMMIIWTLWRRWGLRAGLPIIVGAGILLPSLYYMSPVIRLGADLAANDYRSLPQGYEKVTSIGLRSEFARNTLTIIKEAPFIGHGTGSFRQNYQRVTGFTSTTHRERASSNPHNDYLWLCSEVGPLGAIGLFCVLAGMVAGRREKPQQVAIEAVALSMLMGTMANSFFTDNISGLGFVMIACALVAGPWALNTGQANA
jgi:O-antigen ligase